MSNVPPELMELTEQYLREVAITVPSIAKEGAGTDIIGTVAGRPETEDMKIKLDKRCDEIFQRLLEEYQQYGLRMRVYSEHGVYGDNNPEYLCAIDPFDGSSLYRRGLPAEWFSGLTVFDSANTPVVGGLVDILREEMFLATDEAVVLVSLSDGTRTPISPSRKTVIDKETIISAYLMSPDYLSDWVDKVREMLDRHPGIFIWPNGGTCIYPWLAMGRVHAYIMFGEPRSEIDPGLAFARFADYPVACVNKDGTCEWYQFMPGTQKERIPIFVVAATEDLLKGIVGEILCT